ncbi:unnamed protein product [Cuscuta campestris]|uniref:PPM-type phosphatase domain-containing protein n=1 Tax=Cuscuta campestris TaxID=132261 RepID=A0A484KJ11_9ASTE|nr:unnamed protein product [Cuscuta campestris]
MHGETHKESGQEINISFGYRCINGSFGESEIPRLRRASSSFSCLSGAALSANATLVNTNICNGLMGTEILPALDSPKSFRRIPSSASFSTLLSSSLPSSFSNFSLNSSSPESYNDSFLSNSTDVQVAGGAAGEDRVQAVHSEENGWLFCGIYDGFNGRDAADFLAGTLYERVRCYLNMLDSELDQESVGGDLGRLALDETLGKKPIGLSSMEWEKLGDSFEHKVLNSLQSALNQAENDFLYVVEQEMEDRPDLVSVGSCVLLTLLYGKNIYVLNLGDSRAVLATYNDCVHTHDGNGLQAVQLTPTHTVDDELERNLLLNDHPDDPSPIVAGKVKGKLKVTRALGVGYLKKKNMNEALMGILKVRNLISPPYVSAQPSLFVHEISSADHFVILGSDGLFDFFTNDELVKLVHSYLLSNTLGDPAKFLVEQLVMRAASSAGFSMEEMLSIPDGMRRKYHDDVTVIVIILGTNQRTSKASTQI